MPNNNQPVEGDLNTIIVSAVNARVESAVAAALAGDEVMGRYITAALQRQVEVPSANGYGKDRVPFMSHIVESAVRDATKAAVSKFISEQHEVFETEVRKHLRKAAPEFAQKMVGQLVETASQNYGIQVSLRTGRD